MYIKNKITIKIIKGIGIVKLRYDNYQKKQYNVSMSFSIVFFVVIIFQCIILMFSIKASFSSISFLNMVLFLMIFLIGIICILIPVKNIKQNNNKGKIKELGIRVSANIMDVCTIVKGTGRYSRIKVNCFTVVYDNNQKTSRIEFIEDNDAYALLKMLLNPYPIKEEIHIPIDIYLYNNEIYADLESVDFTKVKGYKECKKVIDEIYHNE